MKQSTLKFLDRFFGPFLIFLFRKKKGIRDANPAKFLVIRPGGIGDAVLLLPVLQNLKRAFPYACIDMLAERRNAEVFSFCPQINRTYLYDNPLELISAVRKKYDVVIDTEQWHYLSALVARLTRTPFLIGFATNKRARLFTDPVIYSHEDFETDSFFRLLQSLSVEKPGQALTKCCVIPDSAKKRAAKLLGDTAGKVFIAVFPGASIQEKRWDTECFAELTDYFAQKGIPVVILGGKSEILNGEKILEGKSGINLAGKSSLVETTAVIEKAALMISGDSGILHLAVCLGRPTISLFGPSSIRKWAPKGEHHITISKNLPCSPCSRYGYTPKCSNNVKCMKEIKVADVIAAVEKLLRSNFNNSQKMSNPRGVRSFLH